MKPNKYILTDYNCKKCHGRILELTGNYITCGGNAIYMCASCERTSCDITVDSIGYIRKTKENDK